MEYQAFLKLTKKIGLNIVSRIVILLYLFLTTLTSFIFMVENDYRLINFNDFAVVLHLAFIISITIALLIYATSHRYIISFILITLSSAFLIFCLYNIFNNSWVDPWMVIGGIKIAIYILISNLIIITSIIYKYKKHRDFKKLNRV